MTIQTLIIYFVQQNI